MAARSALRLKNFELSRRMYKIASNKGWKLRDHDLNRFEAELKSGNIVDAFVIAMRMEKKDHREDSFTKLHREISRAPKDSHTAILSELNKVGDIPEILASLSAESVMTVKSPQSSEVTYAMVDSEKNNADRYRRETIRVRQSSTYKIAQHLENAYRRPWRIPFLPFTLPLLAVNLARERKIQTDSIESSQIQFSPSRGTRRSIVMFPTNGVGFGHFTRLFAIARKIKKKDPDLEIIFFTTMPTLWPLESAGFPTYHIPGRYRYPNMEPKEWNAIAEEKLSMVLNIHKPSAFIFDGSYPYRGMLNAISNNNEMLKLWVRRGAIRPGSKSTPEGSFDYFDAVIKPGDSVPIVMDEESESGIPVITCNPITLFDSEEILPRGELRSRLGVPEEALVAYVQLGAGRINNINSELRHTINALGKYEQVYTIFGESIIGERYSFPEPRLRTLRDYPNSIYFNDFDFAIMAGGYNSFHESVQTGLPTISFPNMNTGRDDQLARVKVGEEAGCMVVIESRSKRSISAAIDRIIDPEVRDLMRSNSEILRRDNGAEKISDWILEKLPKS